MLAAKRLEVSGGVDVGDRRNLLIGIDHFANFAPGAINLGQVRHIGHRTTRAHVGQYHLLRRLGEYVGDFRHKVHAAEHQVIGIGARGEFGQAQRIAHQIGMTIHIGTLIVMAEYDRALAQRFFRGKDARLTVFVG